MSTTETDFWSRIDSEPTADAEPQQSPSDASQASDNETVSNDLASSDSPAARSPEPRVARPDESGPEKSKSQRIREFMADRPEARNRDIVEALGEYGVTAADVSNVRTQLRKKAEKQQKAKTRVESSAAPRSPVASRAARASAPVVARGGATAANSGSTPAAGEIAMTEIEAGLTFIEQVGSIERARQVVDLIARIRDISLNR